MNIQDALTKAIIEHMPPDLKKLVDQGWVYRDMPGKIAAKTFDEFMSIFSIEDYKLIAYSEGVSKGLAWKRCQMLISPAGMEKLKNYKK